MDIFSCFSYSLFENHISTFCWELQTTLYCIACCFRRNDPTNLNKSKYIFRSGITKTLITTITKSGRGWGVGTSTKNLSAFVVDKTWFLGLWLNLYNKLRKAVGYFFHRNETVIRRNKVSGTRRIYCSCQRWKYNNSWRRRLLRRIYCSFQRLRYNNSWRRRFLRRI